MPIEIIRYTIATDRIEAFLTAHRRALACLGDKCSRYELCGSSRREGSFQLTIEWPAERMGHLRHASEGSPFQQALREFEQNVEERSLWNAVELLNARGSPQAVPDLVVLPDRPPWNRLRRWIGEHMHERIIVDDMAGVVGMSPRNFARVFKRQFRIPPGAYLDRVRVLAAKSDLDEGRQAIDQIAAARGFGSASTMRRVFYRVLGVTPNHFRNAGTRPGAVYDDASVARNCGLLKHESANGNCRADSEHS